MIQQLAGPDVEYVKSRRSGSEDKKQREDFKPRLTSVILVVYVWTNQHS